MPFVPHKSALFFEFEPERLVPTAQADLFLEFEPERLVPTAQAEVPERDEGLGFR